MCKRMQGQTAFDRRIAIPQVSYEMSVDEYIQHVSRYALSSCAA